MSEKERGGQNIQLFVKWRVMLGWAALLHIQEALGSSVNSKIGCPYKIVFCGFPASLLGPDLKRDMAP